MSGHPVARFSALFLALTLAACAAYQAQHAPLPSRESAELPDDPRITHLHDEAGTLKAELARQGRYACCIEPPCTQCLLQRGECHCRASLRKEGPCADCCGECRDGWIDGRVVAEGETDKVYWKGDGEKQQEQDHQHQHPHH
ncbi:MAG TPA: hypothetical protein VE685_12345 [Thermoanaerobaculia bacterium]|nr:hypothetical protein [Thermoanaerobaculia bacterium]